MRFKVQIVKLTEVITVDHLGETELNQWMAENYGKYAKVRITRENDGKVIEYTDNGDWWEKI